MRDMLCGPQAVMLVMLLRPASLKVRQAWRTPSGNHLLIMKYHKHTLLKHLRAVEKAQQLWGVSRLNTKHSERYAHIPKNELQHLQILQASPLWQLQQVKPYTEWRVILAGVDEHLPRSYLTSHLPLGRVYQFPPGWPSTMCQENITAAPYPLCDSVIPSAPQPCLQNSDSLHVHVATLHWGGANCQVFCAFIWFLAHTV